MKNGYSIKIEEFCDYMHEEYFYALNKNYFDAAKIFRNLVSKYTKPSLKVVMSNNNLTASIYDPNNDMDGIVIHMIESK